jgi:hypothetical protein
VHGKRDIKMVYSVMIYLAVALSHRLQSHDSAGLYNTLQSNCSARADSAHDYQKVICAQQHLLPKAITFLSSSVVSTHMVGSPGPLDRKSPS